MSSELPPKGEELFVKPLQEELEHRGNLYDQFCYMEKLKKGQGRIEMIRDLMYVGKVDCVMSLDDIELSLSALKLDSSLTREKFSNLLKEGLKSE